GFDEADFVFVSQEKANELRSSLARRGDIVITQRGTLGQVGMIPRSSRFERYVLSQSQMKLTVDPAVCDPLFVYSQFRMPETTDRFIAQAMSSGVPHVNLTLLRDFELLIPLLPLQRRFGDVVEPLERQSWLAREQADRLTRLRTLLVPKVVNGQIDVVAN